MDPERRNRIQALASTTNDPLGPLVQEMLKEMDRAEAKAKAHRQLYESTVDALANTQLHLVDVAADAERLAQWIIKHPQPGPEMHEVLKRHDENK